MQNHHSKKVFIWPYLSFETKKKFPGGWWVVGGGWVKSDFSVSLCPFSFGHTDTQTEKWTQSLTMFWCFGMESLSDISWIMVNISIMEILSPTLGQTNS